MISGRNEQMRKFENLKIGHFKDDNHTLKEDQSRSHSKQLTRKAQHLITPLLPSRMPTLDGHSLPRLQSWIQGSVISRWCK